MVVLFFILLKVKGRHPNKMKNNTTINEKSYGLYWKSWLYVLLCTAAIYSTIPLARSAQKFVYATLGREFFMYISLLAIIFSFAILTYYLIVKLKIRNIAQYAWLLLCAALFIYFTIQLKQSPEEAIHLLEYGLLAYFVFKALSIKTKDWTVYINTILIVLIFGSVDELIQWITPSRVGDFGDIKINALAGFISTLAIALGIRPSQINHPASRDSVVQLIKIAALASFILGICIYVINGYL